MLTAWLRGSQCWLIVADSMHTIVQCYLQRRERRRGSSDLLYYASLVPEFTMQCCRLLHPCALLSRAN